MKQQPAFPVIGRFRSDDNSERTTHVYQSGMTLQQYYAGQALAGLCANSNLIRHEVYMEVMSDAVVNYAQKLAEKMMEDVE